MNGYPAEWLAPPRVRTHISTRDAGDMKADATRAQLRRGLPSEPLWLTQVHGTRVVDAASTAAGVEADAATTRETGRVLAILTADCLPVLFCDRAGTVIGAAHAGWRGLLEGVLENTIDAMGTPPEDLLAYIGPGIGPDAYEVGPELRERFVARDAGAASAFKAGRGDRWFADLPSLARQRLAKAGIMAAFGASHCTFHERELFFSYRRDGVTGRMASLIWLSPAD